MKMSYSYTLSVHFHLAISQYNAHLNSFVNEFPVIAYLVVKFEFEGRSYVIKTPRLVAKNVNNRRISGYYHAICDRITNKTGFGATASSKVKIMRSRLKVQIMRSRLKVKKTCPVRNNNPASVDRYDEQSYHTPPASSFVRRVTPLNRDAKSVIDQGTVLESHFGC